MNISKKASEISSFLVMDVLEQANQMAAAGENVIHLEVGEPDFETPACIRDAACCALSTGQTHYTHSQGVPELREAICAHYKRTYGVSIEPDQVIVTAGSSPALLMAFMLLCDAGDEIILTDPYYACYVNFARSLDIIPTLIPTGRSDGFQLNPEKVKAAINERSRAILINSPANPTGICLDDEHLRELSSLSLPIISDEIYHGLVYEGEQHSILEYTDQAIVINGFSKAWAMTGWRLGWAIFPKELIRSAQKINQNLMICAPAPAQWAGIAALEEAGEDARKMHEIFAERRRVTVAALKAEGLNVELEPNGAFYVLVNVSHLCNDSLKLAFDILKNTGVGVTPGVDFGPGAEGYIRISYANSTENIVEGVKRVGAYLRSLA